MPDEDGKDDEVITDDEQEDVEVDMTPSDDDDEKKGGKAKDDTATLRTEFDTYKKEKDAELVELRGKHSDLKSALHQARQANKAGKKKDEEEPPLTDDQLLKILRDNEGDPQTILNVVKYQAKRAATKASKDELTDSALRKKVTESNTLLGKLYPGLSDDSSKIRASVDRAKADYGLDDHPLGDLFATGVEVLNNLTELLSAAEERGRESATKTKGTADSQRKAAIKAGQGGAFKATPGKKGTLSESQEEVAGQMNLTPSQRKIMAQISGKKTQTVSVKEA